MIKHILHAYHVSMRSLVHPIMRMIVLFVASVAFVASVYGLFAVREANTFQVIATCALALIVPIVFFIVQSLAVNYADSAQPVGAWIGRAFHVFWQLLAISVLPILGVWILAYIADMYWAKVVMDGPGVLGSDATAPHVTMPVAISDLRWQEISVVSLRYLLFGFVLPLALVQLWITVAREGLLNASMTVIRSMRIAFAPQTVLTYCVGLLVFAVIPYLLVFTPMHVVNLWWDMILLGSRIVTAVMLCIGGWIATVGAISVLRSEAYDVRE